MCIACKSVASIGIASALLFAYAGEGRAGVGLPAVLASDDSFAHPAGTIGEVQGGIRRGDAVNSNSAAPRAGMRTKRGEVAVPGRFVPGKPAV